MVRYYHELNGREFEQTLGDSGGQGSLACCRPWGSQRVRHDLATEQQQQSTQTGSVVCHGKESEAT